jgi:hypothetical protein
MTRMRTASFGLLEEFGCKFRIAASTMALAATLALSACDNVTFYKGVTFGPPPPLGIVGVSPSPGWVWTDGYYSWGGSRWMWQPGRWARPPRPGYVWRKPFYEPHRNGYRVHRGHWVRP